MRPVLVAAAVAAATLSTALVAPHGAAASPRHGDAAARRRCGNVEVIGHRGVGGPHEDTIKGFNLAARGGADVVETDVWLTKDRVPVIIHDPTWKRTTNWHGRVRKTRYSVVRNRIRTDGGDRIPTLRRALHWSARHRAGLMVDVKWKPNLRRVAHRIRRLGIRGRVSFYERPFHKDGNLKAIDRARGLGLRTGVKAWYRRWPMSPRRIRSHGSYVVVGQALARRRKYVRRMHRAHVKVYPKGSTRKSWPALLRAGVNGLTVPNPRRYRVWCRGRH